MILCFLLTVAFSPITDALRSCTVLANYPNGVCLEACTLDCSVTASVIDLRNVSCVDGKYVQGVCTSRICSQCTCTASNDQITEVLCQSRLVTRFPLSLPTSIQNLTMRGNTIPLAHLDIGLKHTYLKLRWLLFIGVPLNNRINFTITAPGLYTLDIQDAGLEFTRIPTASPSLRELLLERNDALNYLDLPELVEAFPVLSNLDIDSFVQFKVTGAFTKPFPSLRRLDLFVTDCAQAESWGLDNLTHLHVYLLTCLNSSNPVLNSQYFPNNGLVRYIRIIQVVGTQAFDYTALDMLGGVVDYDDIRNRTTTQGAHELFIRSDTVTCIGRVAQQEQALRCNCTSSGLVNAPYCPKLQPTTCLTSPECILVRQICDGVRDCDDGSDEEYCQGRLQLVTDGNLPSFLGVECFDNVSIIIDRGVMRAPQPLKKWCYKLAGALEGIDRAGGQFIRSTLLATAGDGFLHGLMKLRSSVAVDEVLSFPCSYRVVEGALLGVRANNRPNIPVISQEAFMQRWTDESHTCSPQQTTPILSVQPSGSDTDLVLIISIVVACTVLAVGMFLLAFRRGSRRVTGTVDFEGVKTAARKHLEANYERLLRATLQSSSPRMALRSLEIDHRSVTVRSKLAKGRYGPIYAGIHDGHAVRIESCETQNDTDLERFIVQCHLYDRLREHPNVLQLQFVHLTSLPMSRGFEAAELGSLKQFLSMRQPKSDQRLAIMKQIASGLSYFHASDVVHGRLNSDTVLITSEAAINFVKLSDFGNAQHELKWATSTVAPEVLASQCTSKAGDVFALGCIGVETVINNSILSFDEAQSLFKELQSEDTSSRPTAQHALFALETLSTQTTSLRLWTYTAGIPVTGQHYTSLVAGFGSMQSVNKTQPELHHVPLECLICEDQTTLSSWIQLGKTMSTLRHPHLLPIISLTTVAVPSTGYTMDAVIYPQGALLQTVSNQYTASELRRMICVDALLGLEFLAARQIFISMLDLAQCRVLDGRCQLIMLSQSTSTQAAVVVTAFQRFLVSCKSKLALEHDSVLQQLLSELSESTQTTVGSKANPVSLLVIKAQNLCLNGVQWELSFDSLEFVSQLGQGAFGDVSLMRLLKPVHSPNATEAHRATRFVAVKRLLDPACQAEFEQELAMMSQMHHPNLVSLLWVVNKPSCLVLEYLDGGSLDDWLVAPTTSASDDVKRGIACGVTAGMAELARLNIVHRDLAARNVLVSNDASVVKVSDYGLSRLMTIKGADDDAYYRIETKQPIPLRWTAPEVLATRKYSSSSDVYAFGILLHELFLPDKMPFGELDDIALVNLLIAKARTIGAEGNNPTLAAPRACPSDLTMMLEACVQANPLCRPSFSQLLAALNSEGTSSMQLQDGLQALSEETRL
eukprot:m.201311 g.201311  ORF g.201311 m.201311 type:complete len:1377 (+) comp17057_c0_seq5:74-4204(+)